MAEILFSKTIIVGRGELKATPSGDPVLTGGRVVSLKIGASRSFCGLKTNWVASLRYYDPRHQETAISCESQITKAEADEAIAMTQREDSILGLTMAVDYIDTVGRPLAPKLKEKTGD